MCARTYHTKNKICLRDSTNLDHVVKDKKTLSVPVWEPQQVIVDHNMQSSSLQKVSKNFK